MPDTPSGYHSRWYDYFHPQHRRARGGALARSRGRCQGCGYWPAKHAHHWALRCRRCTGPAGERPGRIVEELRRVGVRNPVFVLDEVDRLDEAGAAAAALLEAIDPPPGAAFRDRYLDLPFDLSEAVFVATATDLGSAPAMLRERMQVVELPGYAEAEKREIAARYLLPGLLRLHGLKADQVEFTDEAIGAIIGGYTREAGVRLAAVLGEVCAKVVRRRSEGDTAAVVVTPAQLAGMLGAPRHPAAEVAGRTGRPGVAVGLCCTAGGGVGAASVIEASRMAGSGALTLTGGLGEAMQESARAVLSWLRANAGRYDIDPDFHRDTDIHLHVDGGPGEGTSGGVTMTAALVSALTGRVVRGDLAMTGEVGGGRGGGRGAAAGGRGALRDADRRAAGLGAGASVVG